MTTERSRIEVSGISIEIVRKAIKNLHVGVHPPYGRVRVAVPLRIGDEAVRLAIVSRLGWINRQRKSFANQERQSTREFVSGETHYYQGHRYRLMVVRHDGPATVSVKNRSTLELRIRANGDRNAREKALTKWYRDRMRERVLGLIAKWESRIGVKSVECHIRKMRTRWGTCNASTRRISLNLELIKKPTSCMEYILVHEMIHLLERRHNDRFRDLLDKFMPQWRTLRAELNCAPLAHEDWEY